MITEIEELELLELEKEKFSLGIKDTNSILGDYVKPDPNKPISQSEILDIIRGEISRIPKVKPQKVVERIVEKQIIKEEKKEEKKDNRKFAEEKSVEDLKKEVQDLKDLIDQFKQILPMLAAKGGSGVIGLPNLDGNNGKTLQVANGQPVWRTATSGGGGTSSDAYTPTNVTTDRSFNATDTSLDEMANVLGSLIASLQGAGIIQ